MGVVSWESHGRLRAGCCLGFLGYRCRDLGKADVYVHHSKSFKLPEDGTDVIMVGPGTGIAPVPRLFARARVPRRLAATGCSLVINTPPRIISTHENLQPCKNAVC